MEHDLGFAFRTWARFYRCLVANEGSLAANNLYIENPFDPFPHSSSISTKTHSLIPCLQVIFISFSISSWAHPQVLGVIRDP